MTTAQESEVLTRVGPNTLIGELMRNYWIPAAISSELTADGDPMRLMLLGEKLVAFRDTNGKVGVMDHRCPHRCASLFFGRNEEGGIRCVYHGWKFDADGNCLDMANVPAHQDFKHKIHAKAYKTAERNGLIWVFMGDQDKVPDLPMLEPNLLDAEQCTIRFVQRECNWLQALEGDIDQTHLAFLHLGHVAGAQLAGTEGTAEGKYTRMVLENRTPEFADTETDYGIMGASVRETGDGQRYWRVSQFLFPFWTMPSNRSISDHVVARGWVPMDDTHTMFVQIGLKHAEIVPRRTASGTAVAGINAGENLLANTTDWYGRWRFASDGANDYMIDRDEQRCGSYTGIEGIHLQDQAITESMGPIVDHTFEHLAPSDSLLIRTRKRLLRAARALADDGTPPPGVEDPSVFLKARGGGMVMPKDADWLDAYVGEMQKVREATGYFLAAE